MCGVPDLRRVITVEGPWKSSDVCRTWQHRGGPEPVSRVLGVRGCQGPPGPGQGPPGGRAPAGSGHQPVRARGHPCRPWRGGGPGPEHGRRADRRRPDRHRAGLRGRGDPAAHRVAGGDPCPADVMLPPHGIGGREGQLRPVAVSLVLWWLGHVLVRWLPGKAPEQCASPARCAASAALLAGGRSRRSAAPVAEGAQNRTEASVRVLAAVARRRRGPCLPVHP